MLRVLTMSLLAAFCLTQAAYAQDGVDEQVRALVRRLQEGDRRERLAAAEGIKERGAAAKAAAEEQAKAAAEAKHSAGWGRRQGRPCPPSPTL